MVEVKLRAGKAKDDKAEEINTLGRSLAVLCVTLIGIYSIFFGVQGTSLDATIAGLSGAVNLEETMPTPQEIQAVLEEDTVFENENGEAEFIDEEIQDDTAVRSTTDTETVEEIDTTMLGAAPVDQPGKKFYSFQELFGETGSADVETIVPLSGTYLWEGVMKSAELLWLSDNIQYILKDISNTHYAYLGSDFTERLEAVVLQLGGNIVEINDKNDIKHNLLFGERVQFVNLPEYEGVKVLVVVFFNSPRDVRLLQVDADQRYQQKIALAEAFDKRYDR